MPGTGKIDMSAVIADYAKNHSTADDIDTWENFATAMDTRTVNKGTSLAAKKFEYTLAASEATLFENKQGVFSNVNFAFDVGFTLFGAHAGFLDANAFCGIFDKALNKVEFEVTKNANSTFSLKMDGLTLQL